MTTARPRAEQGQYLGFFIADEEYAVGILKVKEILQFEAITKIPGTPPMIRGVTNVRGSVVPVIDLAVRFGLPELGVTQRTCIVIVEVDLEGEKTIMGVMADSVSQVIDLGSDDIQAPPAFGTRVHLDYILGMGSSGKKFILILDIDRILSVEELMEVTKLQGTTPDAAPAGADVPAPPDTAANVELPETPNRPESPAGLAALESEALEDLVRDRPGRGARNGAGRKEK